MKNIKANLISFVPFLLYNFYIFYNRESNSGINWNHSIIAGLIFGISITIANKYRSKK